MQKLITKRTSTKQQMNNKQKSTAQSKPKMNNKKRNTTTHIVTRQTRSNKTMNKYQFASYIDDKFLSRQVEICTRKIMVAIYYQKQIVNSWISDFDLSQTHISDCYSWIETTYNHSNLTSIFFIVM